MKGGRKEFKDEGPTWDWIALTSSSPLLPLPLISYSERFSEKYQHSKNEINKNDQ